MARMREPPFCRLDQRRAPKQALTVVTVTFSQPSPAPRFPRASSRAGNRPPFSRHRRRPPLPGAPPCATATAMATERSHAPPPPPVPQSALPA